MLVQRIQSIKSKSSTAALKAMPHYTGSFDLVLTEAEAVSFCMICQASPHQLNSANRGGAATSQKSLQTSSRPAVTSRRSVTASRTATVVGHYRCKMSNLGKRVQLVNINILVVDNNVSIATLTGLLTRSELRLL